MGRTGSNEEWRETGADGRKPQASPEVEREGSHQDGTPVVSLASPAFCPPNETELGKGWILDKEFHFDGDRAATLLPSPAGVLPCDFSAIVSNDAEDSGLGRVVRGKKSECDSLKLRVEHILGWASGRIDLFNGMLCRASPVFPLPTSIPVLTSVFPQRFVYGFNFF